MDRHSSEPAVLDAPFMECVQNHSTRKFYSYPREVELSVIRTGEVSVHVTPTVHELD